MACEKSENWLHAKCHNFEYKLYAKMKDMMWYCSNCQEIYKLDSEPETERQLFLTIVVNTKCTVNGEPETLLRKVNTLH